MGQLIPNGLQNLLNLGNTFWPARAGNLVVLCGITNGGPYSSLRVPGSTTDYTAPAGKSFKGIAMRISEHNGVACGFGVGYSTGAPTWAGGVAPATPIQYMGGAAAFLRMGLVAANTTIEVPLIGWSIPTGKYGFVTEDAGGICSFIIYGYEE